MSIEITLDKDEAEKVAADVAHAVNGTLKKSDVDAWVRLRNLTLSLCGATNSSEAGPQNTWPAGAASTGMPSAPSDGREAPTAYTLKRLPPELWAKVKNKAYLEGKTCNQVVREILAYYFDQLDVGE